MEKLFELEAKLKKAKEELEKNASMGYGNDAQTGMPAGTADVNMAKEEDCDDKIEDKMDEHNEKKHGEAKDEDSAKKSDIPKEITDQPSSEIIADNDPEQKPKSGEKWIKKSNESLSFNSGGQWSLNKALVADMRPDGEFDVPVKEVYDGDDEFVHVGNRGVDGDDKGKTEKLADKEKKMSTTGSSTKRTETKLNEYDRKTTNTTSGKKVPWGKSKEESITLSKNGQWSLIKNDYPSDSKHGKMINDLAHARAKESSGLDPAKIESLRDDNTYYGHHEQHSNELYRMKPHEIEYHHTKTFGRKKKPK